MERRNVLKNRGKSLSEDAKLLLNFNDPKSHCETLYSKIEHVTIGKKGIRIDGIY